MKHFDILDCDDAVFAALAHERRRVALRTLGRYDDAMALADLADEVATWEADGPITEVPAEYVKEVYLSLYHAHVPKLREASLVRYDQEGDLVTLTADSARTEQCQELLDLE